jgi:methyl-accepting chemotaxis protein
VITISASSATFWMGLGGLLLVLGGHLVIITNRFTRLQSGFETLAEKVGELNGRTEQQRSDVHKIALSLEKLATTVEGIREREGTDRLWPFHGTR